MPESRRYELPRFGDRLLERQPCAGTVLDLVPSAEALASPGHPALVALPFVQEHPEPEPAFLVLRDSPQARRGSVVAMLQQRTRAMRSEVGACSRSQRPRTRCSAPEGEPSTA
jgi:hypothetical protein